MTKITYIPGEIANAAIDEHGNRKPVTRTQHIFDDAKGKSQSEVNADIDEKIAEIKGGSTDSIATLNQKIVTEQGRAQDAEQGLNNRLSTVEKLAEISVSGGDIGIGTTADFESDNPSDLAKVPTVGAILGGANDGVYDISARHNGTKYADLAAALGTNGANVPQSLRKGGMSIKFVQSSDNKYVQYRLMANAFTTDTTQWQGVDDEPVAGSNNLVKSGGVADADVELFEKINNKTLDIDKEYSLDIDVPAIGNYTLIPIQLKAGRYEVTATAIGEGSPFLYINNASKQSLGNLLSSRSRIFDLAQENECLFISTDDRNTATRVTIKITYSDEAFVPFQYGSKRKYLLNVSTNKWTVNNNTYHLQIPVHEGDIIRTKGKNTAILYGFLASEILHPVAGDDVPVLDSGAWPQTTETVTTVPTGATILIIDALSAANVDTLPLYLSINGFDIINDSIGGILQSGNGNRFIGVVTPETVISTPKQNAFAIGAKGTYTQFGGSVIVPEGCVGVFTYDISWSAAIVDVLGYAVPSVWAASVNNCISHVQANNLLSGKNGDSFVFVTDSHFPENKGNGVILAAAVSKKTNNKMFVHGGDFVTKNKTKEQFFTILRNYAEQLKVLYGENWRVLFGNHDNNTQDGNGDQSQLTTKDDFYALMYKGFESEIINPNRNMYYYWDNANQNIRYVCFDFGVGGIGKEQVTWFASVAQSAPQSARIVIINHGMWNVGSDETFFGYNVDLANMCDAINTRSNEYTFDGYTYDFSSITAKVGVILCGHIHGIKSTYYGESLIPVIALEADMYNSAETSPVTLFTQKVHFIDLDYTNGKIYIFTLGYNINNSQGRDRKEYDIVV